MKDKQEEGVFYSTVVPLGSRPLCRVQYILDPEQRSCLIRPVGEYKLQAVIDGR